MGIKTEQLKIEKTNCLNTLWRLKTQLRQFKKLCITDKKMSLKISTKRYKSTP